MRAAGTSPSPRRKQGISTARVCAGKYRCAVACCILFAAASPGIHANAAIAAQERDADGSLLAEEVDLARLVDLCSARLRLNLEYDPAVLRGTVTFRFPEPIADQELWVLTNRLLAAHGLTTVQMAGEKTLSVVKLAEAAGQARIEPSSPSEASAGFVRVVRRVASRPAKELVASIQLVLSKPGGSVSHAEGSDLLVIADLRPQVEKALELLALLDVPREGAVVEEVPVEHLPATELVTLVERVLQTQAGLDPGGGAARLIATPDERRVLVVAPADQIPRILDLLRRFDRREPQTTRTYALRAYSAREVARLIDEILSSGAKGTGAPPFRLVEDDLTQALLLTATASEHAQVEALLARVEAAAGSVRRPIRSFKLKNRPVAEVLSLLQTLIAAGAVSVSEGGAGEDPGSTQPGDAPRSGSGAAATPPTESPIRRTDGESPAVVSPQASEGARGAVLLSADEGTNTLIAVGDASVLSQIDDLVRTLDVRQPQVMLQALVLALSESDALDLGVELQRLSLEDDVLGRVASLFGLGSPDPEAAALPAPAGTGFHAVVLDPKSFSAIVRALETLNRGRSLTIPRVLVNNHQQGRLDSVLQTPYTSTNASNTVATTSFGGTIDAGTAITVRPQIAEGDHLLLEYDVSVSQFVGESVDPTLPPPRQQNKVASSVTIPDGFTVVVGGLEIETNADATSAVPWISRIPLLGRLFESTSRSRTKSRLYVFLRADVIRGMSFEALKYASDRAILDAGIDDGPRVEPSFIR